MASDRIHVRVIMQEFDKAVGHRPFASILPSRNLQHHAMLLGACVPSVPCQVDVRSGVIGACACNCAHSAAAKAGIQAQRKAFLMRRFLCGKSRSRGSTANSVGAIKYCSSFPSGSAGISSQPQPLPRIHNLKRPKRHAPAQTAPAPGEKSAARPAATGSAENR
jgi:hypothetical protein